jgi:hypothetical protein
MQAIEQSTVMRLLSVPEKLLIVEINKVITVVPYFDAPFAF